MHRLAQVTRDARSTRAGTRVPATVGDGDQRAHRQPSASAQRGPGLASRQRTAPSSPSAAAAGSLNEGRDSRPGNGGWLKCSDSCWMTAAQRGPGLASRQRAITRSLGVNARVPLNEGRDSRPGNGMRTCGRCWLRRSPLNEGRDSRPGNGRPGVGDTPRLEGRSTRAGTRVPATAVATGSVTVPVPGSAQRGPGLASRQRPSCSW